MIKQSSTRTIPKASSGPRKSSSERTSQQRVPFSVKTDYAPQGAPSNTEIMFWMYTIILVISNLFIGALMIPLLLFATGLTLLLIMIFGFFTGYLFTILLTRLDNLERRHHMITSILVPGLSMGTLFIMMSSLNRIGPAIGIETYQNPITIAAAYSIAFFLPHLWLTVFNKKKLKEELEEQQLDDKDIFVKN